MPADRTAAGIGGPEGPGFVAAPVLTGAALVFELEPEALASVDALASTVVFDEPALLALGFLLLPEAVVFAGLSLILYK